MKAVNNKERAKAYNKVIGLFLLSLALALLVGFSTMNSDAIANRKSAADLAKKEAEEKYERDILAPRLLDASATLDKIPTADENKENLDELNQKVGKLLVEAKDNLVKDESWKSGMHQNILKVYSDLHVAYKQQIELTKQLADCQNNTQGSNVDLQRALTENKELKQELNLLRLTGGGGTSGGGSTAQLEKQLNQANEDLRKCRLQNRSLETEINKLKNK